MGSPKYDGNAGEPLPASSPFTQKSPFSKFLNSLSPIKSARPSRYRLRLFESSFPTTPSVFGSPHLDLHQETSYLKREEIATSSSNAHGQSCSLSNSALIPCIPKQLQSCSPSERVDEYLADPLAVENAQPAETCVRSASDVPRLLPSCFTASEPTTEKVDDTNDDIVEVGADALPHLAKKQLLSGSSLVEVSGGLSMDERFNKVLEFSSESICDHVESDEFLEHQVGQEASHHQRGIRRHLQFEVDCKYDPAHSGLHLNNVARSVSVDSDVISSEKLAGYSSQVKHIPGRSNYFLDDINDPLISTGREVVDHVDRDHQSREAVDVANGGNLPNNIESPWDSQQVSCFDQKTLPCDGKMPDQKFVERVEELSQCQDSSKGKRKRETYTDEGEGCKRCNCKRSKCLKLYCECFAAGIYCVDSCACENCYNKPDYEDTVSDVREQIELRNPLAFAPTVVKQAGDSSNVAEDGNWMTPSSARHKRGCKCKRSKCLKKYCECYRAKVGCSDGCRCEDCDNSFGKKSESIFQMAENWKNLSHEKLDTAEVMSDRVKHGITNQFSPTWEELVNAQAGKGSSLQLSPGHLNWCSSALSPTQACVSKLSHELGSISTVCDIMEDGSPVKAVSPRQKRVSPPRLQSDRLGSSSISGLQSGRKFVLQAVPSFPPLSPYCNSEDLMNQTENVHQGNSHDP